MRYLTATCAFLLLASALTPSSLGQSLAKPQAAPPAVPVHTNGDIDLPEETVPLSKFLSPEAKAYVNQHLHDMQDPAMTYAEKGIPRFMKPYLERAKTLYPVTMQDSTIAGVHVYDYTPANGIDPANEHRVLINLHGGGFSGCWPGCAELESRPIASVGRIRVVSVDYRQGPEHKFPAASEDVASVYRDLLKTHKPSEIGIYGCSAGGMLTAESVAWFQQHGLPAPGAIGIFCAGAGEFGGDATYTSTPLGEARLMSAPGGNAPRLGYFSDSDPKSPLVTPLVSDTVMAKFPPTLIISGTRDFAMSGALITDTTLTRLGVETDLHVWEGLFHGFFYNPDVPESRDAYNVITRFFTKHLSQ